MGRSGFQRFDEDLDLRDLAKDSEPRFESSCVMSIIPGQSEASLVQMFFYAANKAVIVNEADFWEKSYLLRQKLLVQLLKISVLVSEDDSPTFCPPTIIRAQTPSSVVPNIVHTGPSSASNRHGFIKLSQLPPDSPQRPSSSELLAFSESIKSKFSAASASSVLFCSAVLVRLFSVLLLFCCVPYNGFVLFCCCCYPMAVMAAVSC
ncbi:hypothetical protein RHMOL_Rhmol04G0094800 [Rhododendron molle]|uniref:Uncharacterized protein n=1 Tax=Rhododendron molle TaxID=49168 RepID=A0ACC0NZV9_RHOML|nr:hypothetical protein RHMOL_Rhmol04G0094800 [Rhododendron molle]